MGIDPTPAQGLSMNFQTNTSPIPSISQNTSWYFGESFIYRFKESPK